MLQRVAGYQSNTTGCAEGRALSEPTSWAPRRGPAGSCRRSSVSVTLTCGALLMQADLRHCSDVRDLHALRAGNRSVPGEAELAHSRAHWHA